MILLLRGACPNLRLQIQDISYKKSQVEEMMGVSGKISRHLSCDHDDLVIVKTARSDEALTPQEETFF